MYKWLSRSWWNYLLQPASTYFGVSRFTAIMCRLKGHGDVVFYNPGGYEPDMHCRNCGDDLG